MVPVKHDGVVVGVVQLMTDSGNYSHDQLELFEGLVAQMAAAVRNAQLQQERTRLEAAEAAARAVAAERERAADVLEAVGDGIFLVDEQGVVQLWNRAAFLITGLRGEGRELARLDHRVAGARGANPGRRERRDRASPSRSRSRCAAQTCGSRSWRSTARGASIYAFRDVTGKRRLDEERSDFVATISHELRTPMSAVYGAALTLLREDVEFPEDRRRELLRDDRRAGDAADAHHRGDADHQQARPRRARRWSASRWRWRRDAGSSRRHARAGDGAEAIEIEVPPGDTAASADRDRIQQVLVNLLDNAVKYASGAPVAVRVEQVNGRVRVRPRPGAGHPAGRPAAHLREVLPSRPAAATRRAERGSGSTSRGSWSSGWAAGSGSARSRARARPSRSSCRRREGDSRGARLNAPRLEHTPVRSRAGRGGAPTQRTLRQR